MSLTSSAIQKRTFTNFVAIVAMIAGMAAYTSLGQLEDPEFTIKLAVVSTTYPGASAESVELEVTRSFQEGRNLGVQSTPTLFINGRRLVGSQPFERLKILLDWELERSRTAAAE